MQSAFLQTWKMKISDVVTGESSAHQMPETTRAVNTRSERNTSELGYSSIQENYDRDQTQKAQLGDPDIGQVYGLSLMVVLNLLNRSGNQEQFVFTGMYFILQNCTMAFW